MGHTYEILIHLSHVCHSRPDRESRIIPLCHCEQSEAISVRCALTAVSVPESMNRQHEGRAARTPAQRSLFQWIGAIESRWIQWFVTEEHPSEALASWYQLFWITSQRASLMTKLSKVIRLLRSRTCELLLRMQRNSLGKDLSRFRRATPPGDAGQDSRRLQARAHSSEALDSEG
jgi:hypothetical protein